MNDTPRPQITEPDWNFTEVPEEELVACLVYEYLRESETAQQLAVDFVKNTTVGPLTTVDPTHAGSESSPSTVVPKDLQKMHVESDPVVESLFVRVNQIILKLNHKLSVGGYLFRLFYGISERRKPLAALPWQKLDSESKADLVEVCEKVQPAVFISDTPEHSEKIAKEARAHPAKIYDPDTIPEMRALLDDESCGNEGQEALCIVVDWARYDNGAILEAFENLAMRIAKERPAGITPQSRTGSGLQRQTEWRGMLNSLGLARLGGRYTARELKTRLPEAYDQIAKSLSDQGTTAVQKQLDGARRRFYRRFHEVLPFEKSPPRCLRRPSLKA